MSLPIHPATILAAVQAARGLTDAVASGISEATGFDQVLRQANPLGSARELVEQTVQAIENKLQQLGFEVNQPLDLAVREQGRIDVVGNHERAAEIESRLSGDPELTGLADQLFRVAGPTRLTVGNGHSAQP